MSDVHRRTATQLLAAYGAAELAPSEVVTALAARIDACDGPVRAFTALALDEAHAAAAESDRRWRAGAQRPLEGVPFAVKDLYDTAGVETSYGSPMFAGHVPAADAAAVAVLREAGAVLVGKTSTHEFAWGLTGWNPPLGTGRNPWDLERVAGGSSAGSAAAVALGFVPLALGTDTAGSIRLPASFCGVVGLKPTYGRVGLGGVFPLAPSLDHGGFLTRSPADARLVLSAFADSGPRLPVAGLTIGVCADLMPVPLGAGAASALADTLAVLAALGARRVDVTLASAGGLRPTHGTIQQLEAVATHRGRGLWPGRRDEYGADVAGRLAAAETVSVTEYLAATAERERLRAELLDLFRRVDVLLTPVTPVAPPNVGSETAMHDGREWALRDLVLPFTTPQNLLGLPACAVRAGFDPDGLPVGVQVTGPPNAESLVLSVAESLYEATGELQDREPAGG